MMVSKNYRTTAFVFIFIYMVFCLIFIPRIEANNLTISDFKVGSINTASNTISFSFDVSQENSWRNTTNYDAIWMFIKYSTDGGASWSHASMSGSGTTPTGFSAPSNFAIVVPSDEAGFFLQRTDLSSGNISAEDVTVVWDYAQDGLSDATAQAANTINKIFGIEMVYVQQGSFYAGDGSSSSDYRFKQGSADDEPWYIASENAITTTNTGSDGYYYQNTGASGENANGAVFIIPSSFPKGYQGFYLMKYELSEGQWISFFNTLSNAEKSSRDVTSSVEGGKNSDSVVSRNTVVWDSSNPISDATTTRPSRPVTYISWTDLLAYADWAGLRPMTELEYEKASRGKDLLPVADEYVWGTTAYNAVDVTEIFPDSDENGAEAVFDGGANLNRNSLAWSSGDGRAGGDAQGQKGPLRIGIFAENSTNRRTSGAGYYGNMELSGNLYEPVVTVGRSQGRSFQGTHGDGTLSSASSYEGNATNLDWPGIDSSDSSRGVTGTVGSGYRGGDYASPNLRHFQISNRTYAAKDPDSEGNSQRYDATFGVFMAGRLSRTAP